MGWRCYLSKKKKKEDRVVVSFLSNLYILFWSWGCLAPIPVGIICVKGMIFILNSNPTSLSF